MYLNVPSGGFKVVYEYANRLERRGHRVTILHPRRVMPHPGAIESAKASLWSYKVRIKNRPLINWFELQANVNLSLIPDLRERFVPDADVIFATAYETAFPVARYSTSKGAKFYLLQSYETWSGEESRVSASWKLPLQKVVVSRDLLGVAARLGEAERTTYIPIGLDFSLFRILRPITARTTPRVGMLAHPNLIKGTQDGVAALGIVKEQFPELQVSMFGTEARSEKIPDWMEYVRCPSQPDLVELYNSCQVFLNPSWKEGWGLPAAEAMACGCALVTADNGGAREFALDRVNSLLAPIKRPELLAEKMIELLANHDLRIRLAETGSQAIQRFSWQCAVDSMEQLLVQYTGRE